MRLKRSKIRSRSVNVSRTRGARGRIWWLAPLFVGYLLLTHIAITTHRPELGVVALASAIAGGALVRVRQIHMALVIAAGAAAAAWAAVRFQWSYAALYLPPVLLNAALCWLFGRTLRPGREALITRFSRVVMGEHSPARAAYTRTLTAVWTLLFAALALESSLLAIAASRQIWSLFANGINYAVVAVFFAGEFLWRVFRFGLTVSPWAFLHALARTDFVELSRD